MIDNLLLEKYADLVVNVGVALQKNQNLTISSPIECADIARAIAKAAYKAGAYQVAVVWGDDQLGRIKIDMASEAALADIPNYLVEARLDLVRTKGANISISAGDPEVFSGADPKKMKINETATRKVMKKYFDAAMSNEIRWCVISVPTLKWAKKVFPDKSDDKAMELLWNAIIKSMLLDTENPTLAWTEHNNKLKERAKVLNAKNFDYLHFSNARGTDLNVGLCKNHLWTGGCEVAQDGIEFTANIPTEEIFTAPHKDNVNGILKSALPLVHDGNIIDDFSITFKNGRVVDFAAAKGYDTLKSIIETDEGAKHLGEVALIGKHTPIAEMNLMFFNTLFDENASCHLALGKAYPTTVKNGEKMTEEQLSELGLNSSLTHVDFMIGTPDLQIIGVEKNGNKTQLFKDGEWLF